MKNILIYIILIIIVIGSLLFLNSRSNQSLNQPIIPTIQPTKEITGPVKEFTMTAKQFEFSPATIMVNQGDRVKINIISTDVEHGITIPGFNIDQRLVPNKQVAIDFVADKKGEFTFRCNVPCGEGHMNMTGKLIVN